MAHPPLYVPSSEGGHDEHYFDRMRGGGARPHRPVYRPQLRPLRPIPGGCPRAVNPPPGQHPARRAGVRPGDPRGGRVAAPRSDMCEYGAAPPSARCRAERACAILLLGRWRGHNARWSVRACGAFADGPRRRRADGVRRCTPCGLTHGGERAAPRRQRRIPSVHRGVAGIAGWRGGRGKCCPCPCSPPSR